MASWEIDSFEYSKCKRPDICSGENPAFNPATMYLRMNPFFNLIFLPREVRFSRARLWAIRGLYDLLRGMFLLISLETDDRDRPIALAILLIEVFCQSSSCIFSRSSIEKCLNFIHLIFYQVLQLLVELRRKSLSFKAFSRFQYWIKKFSSPKIKKWFEPMFFSGFFCGFERCGSAAFPNFRGGTSSPPQAAKCVRTNSRIL